MTTTRLASRSIRSTLARFYVRVEVLLTMLALLGLLACALLG